MVIQFPEVLRIGRLPLQLSPTSPCNSAHWPLTGHWSQVRVLAPGGANYTNQAYLARPKVSMFFPAPNKTQNISLQNFPQDLGCTDASAGSGI